MQFFSKQWLATAGVATVLVLIGVFLFARSSYSPSGTSATTTGLATSTITFPETRTINGVTGTGDFTVETVPMADLPSAPDFRAPIKFSSTIAPEVKTQIQAEADILIGRISNDSSDLRSWIDLGTLHKMAGDYKGAETIWLYVSKVAPTNSIAFQNLGDLYQNFLKDYAKAESNFLTAIKNSPNDTNPYRALFQLYTTVYKVGTPAAESILKEGTSAAPKAVDLQVLLARYYKAHGDTAQANAEYDAAIANANSQGETSLGSQIQAEKSSSQ